MIAGCAVVAGTDAAIFLSPITPDARPENVSSGNPSMLKPWFVLTCWTRENAADVWVFSAA